jgi:hypothetical protein
MSENRVGGVMLNVLASSAADRGAFSTLIYVKARSPIKTILGFI